MAARRSGTQGLQHLLGQQAEESGAAPGDLMLGSGSALLEMVERALEPELNALRVPHGTDGRWRTRR